jgi:hypothetical protein
MSNKIILAIDGPSPNVNSGLASQNDRGVGPFTDGASGAVSGTGPGLGPNGIAATSLAVDETVAVLPTTTAVPQVNGGSPGINCGKPSPALQQNATSITAEPSQG